MSEIIGSTHTSIVSLIFGALAPGVSLLYYLYDKPKQEPSGESFQIRQGLSNFDRDEPPGHGFRSCGRGVDLDKRCHKQPLAVTAQSEPDVFGFNKQVNNQNQNKILMLPSDY